MKKFAMVATALAVAPSLAFSAPAYANSPGQLSQVPDFYQVRNVTKNGAYGSTASATCDEVLKFSVKLANAEYGELNNVTLKGAMSGSMTASAKNSADQTTSVSGSVSVSTDKGSLVYVPGSTVNLDVNGNLIKNLPDGIVAGGVNKGSLAGSTREFVQFQAKVKCDTPETPETPEKPAPKVIASTGTGSTIATMFGLSALAAGLGYFVQKRRDILG